MRILHLGKYYWPTSGGIEYALKTIAEIGVSLGHSVECSVSKTAEDTSKQVITKENINGVEVTRLPTSRTLMSTPMSPDFFRLQLKGAEILHLHLPHPFAELKMLYSLLFNKVKKSSLVPYLHALPVSQGLLGRVWFKCITAPILNRSASILVSNANFAKAFPRIKKWENKFRIVTFAAEKILSQKQARGLLPLRSEKKQILALGRMVPYKGYDLLLRAWKPLQSRDEFADYRLVFVGSGPELGSLQKLAQELGVSQSVHFTGPVSDAEKEKFFEESMLYVAPSRTTAETFGISIMEAMAHGLPVITTDVPTGVSILARGGDCGAQVSAGSISELSEAIWNMVTNTHRMQECGEKNIEFIQANHSLDSVVESYKSVIHELGDKFK